MQNHSWKNNVNDIPNSIYNANTLPDIWQFIKKEKRKNITSALRQLFWGWRQSSHSLGILLEIRLYLMQKAFTNQILPLLISMGKVSFCIPIWRILVPVYSIYYVEKRILNWGFIRCKVIFELWLSCTILFIFGLNFHRFRKFKQACWLYQSF